MMATIVKGVLALALVLTASCTTASTQESLDGHTHWLELCERSSDCGELDCLCGMCTVACESNLECGEPTLDLACAPATGEAACKESPTRICQASAALMLAEAGVDGGGDDAEAGKDGSSEPPDAGAPDGDSDQESPAPEGGIMVAPDTTTPAAKGVNVCAGNAGEAEVLVTFEDDFHLSGSAVRDGIHYLYVWETDNDGGVLYHYDESTMALVADSNPTQNQGFTMLQTVGDALLWETWFPKHGLWRWPLGGAASEVVEYPASTFGDPDRVVAGTGHSYRRLGDTGIWEFDLATGAGAEISHLTGVEATPHIVVGDTLYFTRADDDVLWTYEAGSGQPPLPWLNGLRPTNKWWDATDSTLVWSEVATGNGLGVLNDDARVMRADLTDSSATVVAEGFHELAQVATDGKRVAWISVDAQGAKNLWVRSLDVGEPPELIGSARAGEGFRTLELDGDRVHWIATCDDDVRTTHYVRLPL